MKKKTLLFLVIFLLLSSLIVIYYQGKIVDVYIGSTGDTDIDGIDMFVKINDKNVWEGNIHSGLFNYTKIKKKFKIGYNTIEVISKKKNIVARKRVFISFNQHIVIEFMPIHPLVRDKPEFEIWIRRGEFYYE